MAGITSYKTALFAGLIAMLSYFLGTSINRSFTVLGFWRRPSQTLIKDEKSQLVVIANTVHCEDLHYHEPSHTLFTACEDTVETRFQWFPALPILVDPSIVQKHRGSLHVIDPETFESTTLKLSGFSGPFVTHGIDVISDVDRPEGEAVYIYAVNHLPNPNYLFNDANIKNGVNPDMVRSRIEVFHHVLGSDHATYIRSIEHPLIRTPNDIFASRKDSLYITNDHYYRDGFMRRLEDTLALARWTDLVHVKISGFEGAQPDQGIVVSVALDKVHNSNGIGHGRMPDELVFSSCTSGELHFCQVPNPATSTTPALKDLHASVRADCIIDNPSYFADPFATPDTPGDRSGFLLPGLSQGFHLDEAKLDPEAKIGSMVWLASKNQNRTSAGSFDVKLLFEDDGTRIRSVSAAVLLAIDPKLEGGQRKGWLYITGFQSANAIAVKVDL